LDKYSKEPQKPQTHQKLHIVKLHINIGESDLNRHIAQARTFLEKRNQVRVMVQLRGREKSRPQVAVDFLNEVLEQLEDVATPQAAPSATNLSIVLNPAKKKN
jgi:translation initiation factor IF-3